MALRKSTSPVRTCIGCRQRASVAELVKLVARRDPDDKLHVVVDERGRLPGRGAWLHRDRQCVSTAVRRNAFGSALRNRGVVVKPEDLVEAIGVVTHEDPNRGQDR